MTLWTIWVRAEGSLVWWHTEDSLVSLGLHRLWKDLFVLSLEPTANMRILVSFYFGQFVWYSLVMRGRCWGNGGYCLSYRREKTKGWTKQEREFVECSSRTSCSGLFFLFSSYRRQSGTQVVDINENMLQVGMERAKNRGYSEREIMFVHGNAEKLPAATETVVGS